MASIAYAGVDVSQGHLVAQLLDQEGHPLLPQRTVPNHAAGARELAQAWAQVAQEQGLSRLRLGLEATHVYWLPATLLWQDFAWPEGLTVDVGSLNPKLVKAFRDSLDPDREKTDPKDAEAIALQLMLPRQRLTPPLPPQYLALQRLTRSRATFARQLGAEKPRALGWLWLLASPYVIDPPFSDLFGACAQGLLTEFAFPQEVADLAPQDLAAFLAETSRHHFPDPEQKAAQVQASLASVYPLPPAFQEALRFTLRQLLHHIAQLEEHLGAFDQRITAAVGSLADPLLSVPGLGPVLSAGIVAELGGLPRFPSEAAVARYVGLWWPRAQSGQVNAEDRRLSKAGNVYLRYYLLLAAQSVRQHVPTYRDFYLAKYRTARTHKHKRALVLTARKLVRLIVALLKSKQEFRMPPPK